MRYRKEKRRSPRPRAACRAGHEHQGPELRREDEVAPGARRAAVEGRRAGSGVKRRERAADRPLRADPSQSLRIEAGVGQNRRVAVGGAGGARSTARSADISPPSIRSRERSTKARRSLPRDRALRRAPKGLRTRRSLRRAGRAARGTARARVAERAARRRAPRLRRTYRPERAGGVPGAKGLDGAKRVVRAACREGRRNAA